MPYSAEIDAVSENQWHRLLSNFDDATIFQTWGYGAERWGENRLSHLVLRKDGVVVAMAQAALLGTPILGQRLAVIIGGPIYTAADDGERLGHIDATVRALKKEFADKRGMCLRFRPFDYSPSPDLEAVKTIPGVRQAKIGLYKTYVVDVPQTNGQLLDAMDRRWRSNLRKSRRFPLRVTQENNIAGIRLFAEIHEQMSRRKGLSLRFTQMLQPLFERLPEIYKPTIFICWREKVPVAAAVVSALGSRAFYLSGASANSGIQVRGGYFLQWAIIQWLRTEGQCRWYDLYGSRSSAGVRRFKKGLAGRSAREIAVAEFEATGHHPAAVIARAGLNIYSTYRSFQENRR